MPELKLTGGTRDFVREKGKSDVAIQRWSHHQAARGAGAVRGKV
jgi:hypothetical protein